MTGMMQKTGSAELLQEYLTRRNIRLVLASASPRRKELFHQAGLLPEILPSHKEERSRAKTPAALVKALSRTKAEDIAGQTGGKPALVIGADTIVWVDGQAYGKPHDEEHAARMLRRLSADCHEVFTGVTVIRGESCISQFERSLVRFRPLEEEEIRRYIATGEPMDKAGAYGAQGRGALFVEHIEGDFFNVMGLPLCRLGKMLKEQGVNIL